MEWKQTSTYTLTFLLTVSIIGLALMAMLVLLPNVGTVQFASRQTLVGALYILVCLLGAVAVFYPAKCRGMLQKTQNPLAKTDAPSSPTLMRGHHPTCQHYSGNRISLGGRVFCAACSGLLVGAAIALTGAILYFFAGFSVSWAGVWLVAFGEVLLLLGSAQIKFVGYVKTIVNAGFVVGSFMMLVGTDVLGKSVLIDLYALALIVFLLWLRILLSEWNNRRTCQSCRSCFH